MRPARHAVPLAFVLLLAGCFHTPPATPPASPTVTVTTTVTSESQPVAEAVVRIELSPTQQVAGKTAPDGTLALVVPASLLKSHLWADKAGYEPFNQHLDIDGQDLAVPVTLVKIPPPPPDPPPPTPPPATVCRATPLETLKAVRAKFGPSPNGDECVAIINETAWCHRAEGWGLSAKPNGNHAPQPTTGVFVATDILQFKSTLEIYDVLVAAGDGGPATPAWNYVGVLNDPSRPWVPPVAPVAR
jgi:hypothetical protein